MTAKPDDPADSEEIKRLADETKSAGDKLAESSERLRRATEDARRGSDAAREANKAAQKKIRDRPLLDPKKKAEFAVTRLLNKIALLNLSDGGYLRGWKLGRNRKALEKAMKDLARIDPDKHRSILESDRYRDAFE